MSFGIGIPDEQALGVSPSVMRNEFMSGSMQNVSCNKEENDSSGVGELRRRSLINDRIGTEILIRGPWGMTHLVYGHPKTKACSAGPFEVHKAWKSRRT